MSLHSKAVMGCRCPDAATNSPDCPIHRFRPDASELVAALAPQPDPAEAERKLPAVAGMMECSIADHERACLVLLDAEQRKIAPDNHIIATLCDSVRMGREWVAHMTSNVGNLAQVAERCADNLESAGFTDMPNALRAALSEPNAALEELMAAATKYYNEAPQEGDYAILIVSLSGTARPEHAQMIKDYNAARKRLRAALAKCREVLK